MPLTVQHIVPLICPFTGSWHKAESPVELLSRKQTTLGYFLTYLPNIQVKVESLVTKHEQVSQSQLFLLL